MDTYYEDILKKAEKLIEEGNYKNAYRILDEELSMPYIPKTYEERLIELYNTCRSELDSATPVHLYDEDDIEELLQGSLEEQFLAIEQLKKSNIRNHVAAIQTYLSGNPHYLVQSFLLEAMMEQNISEEFTMEVDGLDVTFAPCFIEAAMESDGVASAVSYIREWFENDNPTFTMMCVETLVKEAYLRLPFNVEEEDALDLAVAITRYVFIANGEKEALQLFLDEKGLAQNNGYELLLSKHEM